MDEAKWWWVGGHFDGDGCIILSGGPRLTVSKATKGLESLHYLQKLFGGNIWTGKVPAEGSRRQQSHIWSLQGQSAQDLCQQLAPYTYAKRAQLELVAQWPRAEHGKLTPEKAMARAQLDRDIRALKKQPHPEVVGMPHDAYFAGFFDADGCIRLQKAYHRHQLQAIVTQKYRAILDLFCKRLSGGSVSQSREGYRYCACGPTARALMACVVPYSSEKLPQWQVVMKMHEDPDAALTLNVMKGHRPTC